MSLSHVVIEYFERHGTKLNLNRHQSLATATDCDDELFLIAVGVVHVAVNFGERRLLIGMCRRGDVIGASCLSDFPGLEARAAVRSELYRLSARHIAENGPTEVLTGLRQLEKRRTQDLVRHLILLGRMSGDERVACFLLQQAQRGMPSGARTMELDIGLRRSDFADYLALNPDTLSRIVARFRRDGLILAVSRRSIVVDMQRLRDIVPFCADREPEADRLLEPSQK